MRLLLLLAFLGASKGFLPSNPIYSSQFLTSMKSCSLRCPTCSSTVLRMGEFIDDESSSKLREMLNRQFGKGSSSRPDEWCKPADSSQLQPGTVLLADPEPYYEGDYDMLQRFGLPGPIPDSIPPDRQADLLPCMLIVQHGPRYVASPCTTKYL
jgi:hypothetical protein